jgi:hypothetical protein
VARDGVRQSLVEPALEDVVVVGQVLAEELVPRVGVRDVDEREGVQRATVEVEERLDVDAAARTGRSSCRPRSGSWTARS